MTTLATEASSTNTARTSAAPPSAELALSPSWRACSSQVRAGELRLDDVKLELAAYQAKRPGAYLASASRILASALPYTCSGRSTIATRLSASVMRSYSAQSRLRRRVVAL